MTDFSARTRWIMTWFVLGFGAGAVLIVGDTGHLPLWLLPPLVGVAGAAAGVLSSLMLVVVRRFIPALGRAATWPALLTASAAGAASMALLAAPLGIPQPLASEAGAVAGLISGFLSSPRIRPGSS